MSLHKFAEQVAAHGRGDDSLLVHMTPDEVQRLQKFAEANGRTLTINPHTGLPEAGFLSDLFKAVAPIALGAFLGPAGMGLSAGMAGLATGGITALATGSLSRGLMAGLGAYGGAGLGGSLMNAGTASIGSAAEGIQGPIGSPESGFGATQAIAAAPKADVLSAGFNAATASPTAAMDFAKANYKPLLAAAAPIMAGAMVPTTTPLGTPKSDNYIRQFDFNIDPETGKPDPRYGIRAMTPVKASEWGNKTFQEQRELFRQQNPNPYELGVGSLNQPPQQPTRMAGGGSAGIVALAGGGVPGYAGNDGSLVGGYKPSDTDIFNYFKTPGLTDAQIAADMQKFQVSAADIARATGTQGQQADYEKRFVNTLVAPTTDASEFLKATSAVGLKDQALADAMQKANMSQAAQYAMTHADSDAGFTKGIIDASTGKPVELYNTIGYKAGDLPGDQGGLEGLYGNINYVAKGLQDQINAGKLTVAQAQNLALAEAARSGTSLGDIKAATGSDFGDLFKAKVEKPLTCGPGFKLSADGKSCVPETVVSTLTCGEGFKLSADGKSCIPDVVAPPPFTTVVPGGTKLDTATTYDNGAYGNYGNNTGNPLTSTPGDIITNPDGTRTVVPNIPGRPYGGFTGIQQIKDAYTAGGGSLGYTAVAPRTIAEFNSRFNKMTGDSVAAYDYLMGKGSGKYPVKSGVSQVSVPYAEYVLGKKTTALKKPTTTTTVQGTPGQPQTYFNEAEYLAANPDVAAELKTGKSVSGQPTKFSSGYEHWLMYGKAAGRPFAGDYQGYLTAAALANAPQQGGDAPSGPTGNTGNTISGFTPAPPNESVPVVDMGSMSPAAAAAAADGAAAAAASASGTAPGSDGTPGSGAKRGGLMHYAMGGGLGSLGSYSDGGRLLKGPGDGVSDSIPATIGAKGQPARLADGEFVIPARIVSELGNGSTDAGAKKLYAMMDRVQKARSKTTGKNKVAANSRADKYLPA